MAFLFSACPNKKIIQLSRSEQVKAFVMASIKIEARVMG